MPEPFCEEICRWVDATREFQNDNVKDLIAENTAQAFRGVLGAT